MQGAAETSEWVWPTSVNPVGIAVDLVIINFDPLSTVTSTRRIDSTANAAVLRMAMVTAVESRPGTKPDRASFTTAREAAREELTAARGVCSTGPIDLPGAIGRAVLATLLSPLALADALVVLVGAEMTRPVVVETSKSVAHIRGEALTGFVHEERAAASRSPD